MEKVFKYLQDLINISNNRKEYEEILKELILEYSKLDISPTFHNDYREKQIDVEHTSLNNYGNYYIIDGKHRLYFAKKMELNKLKPIF